MSHPNFIIIGETKCGTTSLYNYLVKHPEILPSKGNGEGYDAEYSAKELRFFDKFYSRGLEWYLSCFPETKSNQITGEATPMYMYRTLAATRIKKHLPNIKLIVLLRNPTDRLLSNFEHNKKWVSDWSDCYPSLDFYFNKCSDRDYYLIEKGLYYFSLLKWFSLFSPNQFKIVISEELFQNPSKTFLSITRFLGVNDYNLSNFPVLRANQYDDIDGKLKVEIDQFYRPYNSMLSNLINQSLPWS